MRSHELDVVLTRGSAVESYHRVHAAVVSDSDKLLGESGDPRAVTFWRSCAKPFQIMPFIASGGFDSLGWGNEELAIACGSHGGEPEHVALIGKMLDDLGLEEGDLACGPQEPLSTRAQKSSASRDSERLALTTTAPASTPRCSASLKRRVGQSRDTRESSTPCSRRFSITSRYGPTCGLHSSSSPWMVVV